MTGFLTSSCYSIRKVYTVEFVVLRDIGFPNTNASARRRLGKRVFCCDVQRIFARQKKAQFVLYTSLVANWIYELQVKYEENVKMLSLSNNSDSLVLYFWYTVSHH